MDFELSYPSISDDWKKGQQKLKVTFTLVPLARTKSTKAYLSKKYISTNALERKIYSTCPNLNDDLNVLSVLGYKKLSKDFNKGFFLFSSFCPFVLGCPLLIIWFHKAKHIRMFEITLGHQSCLVASLDFQN